MFKLLLFYCAPLDKECKSHTFASTGVHINEHTSAVKKIYYPMSIFFFVSAAHKIMNANVHSDKIILGDNKVNVISHYEAKMNGESLISDRRRAPVLV